MNYLLVILVSSLNYYLWKYLFFNTFVQIQKQNKALILILCMIVFLFLPYAISLILLNHFDLDLSVLSSVFIAFCLSSLSFMTYKKLIKNENF